MSNEKPATFYAFFGQKGVLGVRIHLKTEILAVFILNLNRA